MASTSSTTSPAVSLTSTKRLIFAAMALHALVAIASWVGAIVSASQSLPFLSAQSALGLLFWLGCLISLRLEESAELERADRERVEQQRRAKNLESLFGNDSGVAELHLKQWKQRLAPIFSGVFGLLLFAPLLYTGFLTEAGFSGLGTLPEGGLKQELPTAAILTLLGFAALSFGTYLSSLSRLTGGHELRAGASALLATALSTGSAVVALAMASKWSPAPDRLVGLVILAFLCVQGAEILLTVILDTIRPRVEGERTRYSFDSRLTGWLTEPGNIYENMARALDYQFGFKVSETWFYRFLERAFMPLLLLQLLTFYAMSCAVVARPGERLIIERFGAPRGVSKLPGNSKEWDSLPQALGPGLHLKWPWPLEQSLILPADQVRTLRFGFEAKSDEQARQKVKELNKTALSWDREYAKDEQDYILPLQRRQGQEGSIDCVLLRGLFSLDYKIGTRKNGDLYRYAYSHKDPNATLKSLVHREITKTLAGADFWDLLVHKPKQSEELLKKRIEKAIAECQLGIELLGFQIEDLHPPTGPVGQAYQEVLGSRERRKTFIYGGEARANQILSETPAKVNAVINQARSYKHGRAAYAEAQAKGFLNQARADALAPDVYRRRFFFQSIEEPLSKGRKFLKPKGLSIQLDRSQMTDTEESTIESALSGN